MKEYLPGISTCQAVWPDGTFIFFELCSLPIDVSFSLELCLFTPSLNNQVHLYIRAKTITVEYQFLEFTSKEN